MNQKKRARVLVITNGFSSTFPKPEFGFDPLVTAVPTLADALKLSTTIIYDYIVLSADTFLSINTPGRAATAESQPVRYGELTIDLNSETVFCGARRIELTGSEFAILRQLTLRLGKIVPKKKLIEILRLNSGRAESRTVDTHLYAIRKKLGSCAKHLKTERGIGIRLE